MVKRAQPPVRQIKQICLVGVSEGGLEPPHPYRALAPQASASAIPPLGRCATFGHAARLLYTPPRGPRRGGHPTTVRSNAAPGTPPGTPPNAARTPAHTPPRTARQRSEPGGGSAGLDALMRTPPPGEDGRAPHVLGEDADTAGSDEQTDDDEHDAPEELTADDRHDAGDDQDDGEDPQKSSHDRRGTQANLSINGTRLPRAPRRSA